MRKLQSLVAGLLMAACLSGISYAQERAEGPAQQPVEQWFNKSYQDADVEQWRVFYDQAGSYALTVVDFSTGGNSVNTVVGVFRKEADGKYVFLKEGKPPKGLYGGITNVSFKSDAAIVDSAVPKPGDAHCCPTGKRTWKIELP